MRLVRCQTAAGGLILEFSLQNSDFEISNHGLRTRLRAQAPLEIAEIIELQYSPTTTVTCSTVM
jgi:hypothetical protein